MKKAFILTVAFILIIAGVIYTGCSSKKAATEPEEATVTPVPSGPTATPINTAINTVAITPTVLDNFNDNDLNTPHGTSWDTWADPQGSSVQIGTAAPGANSTAYCLTTTANIDGSSTQWPSVSVSTLYPTGNQNGVTSGIRFYYKTANIASNMILLFELLNTNCSDGSSWRYTVPQSSTWTQINIPWTSLQKPTWGTGASIPDLATYLQNIGGIAFAVSAGQANASATNQQWDIDEIELY